VKSLNKKDIEYKLYGQLADVELRLNNVDDFSEWAMLQNAKATILAALVNLK
jgi:hypothetical protein